MKKLFKILIAILLVIVGLVVALVVFVDPNDYKSEIEQQAQNALDRKLVIAGDLGWTVLPSLGITTGEVRIENPTGFNRDNLMEVGSIGVGVQVLPLLTGNIELGKLWVDDFKLNVITNKQGVSNLDGIGGDKAQAAKEAPKTDDKPSGSVPSINSLTLAGMSITNAQIEVQDLVNNSTSLLNVKEISLGEFALGKSAPLKMVIGVATDAMKGDLNVEAQLLVNQALSNIELTDVNLASTLTGKDLPNGELSLLMSSNLSVDLKPVAVAVNDLSIAINDLTLKGSASVAMNATTKVRYTLVGNVWNLDLFMPKPTESESTVESSPQPEVEPDLSFLNTLDIDGTLTLAGLKASGLTIGETKVTTIVKNGVAKIAPLSATLYQGSVLVNASVSHDNGRNSYSVDKKISKVSIQPLLKDLADTNLLAGETNFSFKAKGQGLTLTKIKKKLAGQGDFEVLDGALYGVNIPAKIRSAKATLSGGEVADNEEKKTDFTALTGKFTIADGIANNTVLEMAAPFVRLDGSGLANIIDETLDYRLKATVVGTSKGQGGKAESDLAGVGIPLKISGAFSDPKFALDTSGALKAKLDQEKDKAKDKLKNKLKDKLGGLFK